VLVSVLLAFALMQASGTQQASKTTSPSPTASSTVAENKEDKESTSSELLKVKRIYVDSFGEDPISKEVQSMIVSALVDTKRFKVTENRERADAILKGVALEKTSQEVHGYGESTAVGGASGAHHGEVSGTVVNGAGTVSGSSSGGFVAHHAGISDSSVNTETIDHARVAVRLVNSDGDVIWTSTQESRGAKYKGASADVADKCVKQLLHDVEKLERAANPQGSASSTSTASTPGKTDQH
jgi:curli biogenesis system outer membrane secretion channel CsgG